MYVALLSTLAAFAGWGLLLRRYGASTVAPFSMLVPFFGIASAAVFRHEQIHAVDLIGGALVIGGIPRRPAPAPRPPARTALPSADQAPAAPASESVGRLG